MPSGRIASASIDEYIAAFQPMQKILRKIRATVRKAAPDADEAISYGMPAFKQHGVLVYFAAFTHHIGVFPPIKGDPPLIEEASVWAGPKGNLRFPLDRPIPYNLIERIVRLRLQQNLAKRAKGILSSRNARLAGDPVILADPAAAFSVSDSGVIAYRAAVQIERRLSWFDRTGKSRGTLSPRDQAEEVSSGFASRPMKAALWRTQEGTSGSWMEHGPAASRSSRCDTLSPCARPTPAGSFTGRPGSVPFEICSSNPPQGPARKNCCWSRRRTRTRTTGPGTAGSFSFTATIRKPARTFGCCP